MARACEKLNSFAHASRNLFCNKALSRSNITTPTGCFKFSITFSDRDCGSLDKNGGYGSLSPSKNTTTRFISLVSECEESHYVCTRSNSYYKFVNTDPNNELWEIKR